MNRRGVSIRRTRGLRALQLAIPCSVILALALSPHEAPVPPVPAGSPVRAGSTIATRALPLVFEENRGQTAAAVKFLARGPGYTLFLRPTEAVLALSRGEERPGARVLRMALRGANEDAVMRGAKTLSGASHYFLGARRERWVRDVPNHSELRVAQVYPGVDLVYHGRQHRLEYDFIVAPKVDPGLIALDFEGADELRIDERGRLLLRTPEGDVIQEAPVVYQDIDGVRKAVQGAFERRAPKTIGFKIGAYDTSRPLVIDPLLSYATYLGGADDDRGLDLDLDAAGNAYVIGHTTSTDFPTAGPIQGARGGGRDVFVAKLKADGSELLYATYLGGSEHDEGLSIAVDAAGQVVIGGRTESANFPLVNPFQPTNQGCVDGFVARLDAGGGTLLHSTFIGGCDLDIVDDVAIGPGGHALITGLTKSHDFPTANPLQPARGGGKDAFVARLQADGSALSYSTFLGGSGDDQGRAIAVDPAGNATVVGATRSQDFPTASPLQAAREGSSDAFITRLTPTGDALLYSTFLGGEQPDEAFDVAVDSAGGAFVTGFTNSSDFPTANALQAASGGGEDGFIARLTPDGSALAYATYLGGGGQDCLFGIAINPAGTATVTGFSSSSNYPMVNAVQSARGGSRDAVLTAIRADGQALIHSTYYGGGGSDEGSAVAVDALGNAFIAGHTASNDLPTQNPLQADKAGGVRDAFIARIDAENEPPIAEAGENQFVQVGSTVQLDGQASLDDNTAAEDLIYSWTFTSRPAASTAALSSAAAARPTFIADLPGDYELALTVTDAAGLVSTPDSLVVASGNVAPNAVAGDDQSINVGGLITLDGSGSNDPNNDPLSYSWTLLSKPQGSDSQLSQADSATPTLITDVLGAYELQLVVNDGQVNSAPDLVTVAAVSPQLFVSQKIREAIVYLRSLSKDDFTRRGNRHALFRRLVKALREIRKGKRQRAIKQLEKALERTDGCALRGSPDDGSTLPDGSRPRKDFINNCAAQQPLYDCLLAAIVALENEDPPTISVDDVAVGEDGGAATFTVSLDSAVSVIVSVEATTIDGGAAALGAGQGDYEARTETLVFLPGETSKTLSIPINDDAINEAAEAFSLRLQSPVNAQIGDAEGLATITDNDAAVLSIADAAVNEGSAGPNTVTLTVSLSAISEQAIEVGFATADGTAVAPDDYTAAAATLSIPPLTSSATVTLAINGDVLDEADETFTVTLADPTGDNVSLDPAATSATVTLLDDDPLPQLVIADASTLENNAAGLLGFTVQLSAPSGRAVTVAFTTADGTATAGNDYQGTSGTLTFPRESPPSSFPSPSSTTPSTKPTRPSRFSSPRPKTPSSPTGSPPE